MIPSVVRLRAYLHYDPETGVLRWRPRSLSEFSTERVGRIWNARFANTVAGSLDAYGYIDISVQGNHVKAHRAVWALMTGTWPALDIDHINGVRNDNRWANLRLADRSANNENRRAARSDSKTGLLGVHLHKASGLYQVRIGVRGKDHSIGYFKDKDEAAQAYLDAKRRLHEGCAL